jgi:hypothetical protein
MGDTLWRWCFRPCSKGVNYCSFFFWKKWKVSWNILILTGCVISENYKCCYSLSADFWEEKLLHGCQLLRLLGAGLVQLTTTNYTHSRASTTASAWAMPRSMSRCWRMGARGRGGRGKMEWVIGMINPGSWAGMSYKLRCIMIQHLYYSFLLLNEKNRTNSARVRKSFLLFNWSVSSLFWQLCGPQSCETPERSRPQEAR